MFKKEPFNYYTTNNISLDEIIRLLDQFSRILWAAFNFIKLLGSNQIQQLYFTENSSLDNSIYPWPVQLSTSKCIDIQPSLVIIIYESLNSVHNYNSLIISRKVLEQLKIFRHIFNLATDYRTLNP